MTAPPPQPSSRPRIVEIAFWLWLLSSVLLIVFGTLLLLSTDDVPPVLRGGGALFAVAGVGLAFLGGRARVGHAAFRRATVALALALIASLALFMLMFGGLLWAIPMLSAMVGTVLMMRPSSQAWFEGGSAAQ